MICFEELNLYFIFTFGFLHYSFIQLNPLVGNLNILSIKGDSSSNVMSDGTLSRRYLPYDCSYKGLKSTDANPFF